MAMQLALLTTVNKLYHFLWKVNRKTNVFLHKVITAYFVDNDYFYINPQIFQEKVTLRWSLSMRNSAESANRGILRRCLLRQGFLV